MSVALAGGEAMRKTRSRSNEACVFALILIKYRTGRDKSESAMLRRAVYGLIHKEAPHVHISGNAGGAPL
jgi:hypothetical protein